MNGYHGGIVSLIMLAAIVGVCTVLAGCMAA